MTEVASTYQRRPAYRYLRATDRLPVSVPDAASLDEITAKVRLFNPTGIGTWWIAAYDPETGVAWGVAELSGEREVGAIWMPELVEYRGRFGLPIERDLHYTPGTIAEILGGAR